MGSTIPKPSWSHGRCFPGCDVRTSKSGQVEGGDFATGSVGLVGVVGSVGWSWWSHLCGSYLGGKWICQIDSPLFGVVKNFDLAQMSILFSYSGKRCWVDQTIELHVPLCSHQGIAPRWMWMVAAKFSSFFQRQFNAFQMKFQRKQNLTEKIPSFGELDALHSRSSWQDLSPEACAHLAPALVKLRDQSDTLAQGGETVDVSSMMHYH